MDVDSTFDVGVGAHIDVAADGLDSAADVCRDEIDLAAGVDVEIRV